MTGTRSKSWAACGALLAAAPVLLGATGLTNNMDERVLAAQNRERATLGIPPMRWNDDLAFTAQRWADHLASRGAFEHAPEKARDPEGENLWAGTRGSYSVEGMVAAWVREKQYFKPGVFPDNSVTGRVGDVGHYTQLMWRQTRQVGCAIASGAREDVLVCRYSEAGNYLGEIPF